MSKNDPYLKALKFAYRLLSIRDRTEIEIKRRLREKGYDNDIIDKVVEYLKAEGALNEVRFVQAWIKDRSTFRPKGILAIKDELLKMGADEGVIDAALKDSDIGYSEYEAAKALINRKIGSFKKLNRVKCKKRIYTCLAQRGFSFDIINDIIDTL